MDKDQGTEGKGPVPLFMSSYPHFVFSKFPNVAIILLETLQEHCSAQRVCTLMHLSLLYTCRPMDKDQGTEGKGPVPLRVATFL